jgi:hypothetical protein
MRGDFAGLHSPQQHGNGHARKRLAALAARENKLASRRDRDLHGEHQSGSNMN